MNLLNEPYPSPKFWDKKFLFDFQDKNKDLKICFLVWHKNEWEIIKQIQNAISYEADIIISEILLDEIPEKVLISEYEFLIKKIIFIPPHINEIRKKPEIKKEKILIIADGNCELKYLSKLTQFKFLKYDDDLNKIINNLVTSKKVIIDTQYHHLNHFIIIHCIKHDVPFIIDYDSSFCSRYLACGISLKENINPSKHTSLRSKINSFIENEFNKCSISNEKLLSLLFCCSEYNKFIDLASFPDYKFFINDIYKQNLRERLWIRTWNCFTLSRTDYTPNNTPSRYRKNFIFSILNSSNTNLIKSDDIDFYTRYLVEFLLQQVPSSEWKSEINLLFVHFPNLDFPFVKTYIDLLSKGVITQKFPYLYIISEEFIFASNDLLVSLNDKEILLRKAKSVAISADQLDTSSKKDNYNFIPSIIDSLTSNTNAFIDHLVSEIKQNEKKASTRCNNILRLLPTFYSTDIIIKKLKKINFNKIIKSKILEGIHCKYNNMQMYNAYIFNKDYYQINKYYDDITLIQNELTVNCVTPLFFKKKLNRIDIKLELLNTTDLYNYLFLRGTSIDKDLIKEFSLEKSRPKAKFAQIIREILTRYLKNDNNKLELFKTKFSTTVDIDTEHFLFLTFSILNSSDNIELENRLRISQSQNYYHQNIFKSLCKYIKIS